MCETSNVRQVTPLNVFASVGDPVWTSRLHILQHLLFMRIWSPAGARPPSGASACQLAHGTMIYTYGGIVTYTHTCHHVVYIYYTHMQLILYTCTLYIYLSLSIYIYIYMYIYMYMCVHMCMCVYIYIIHICVYIYIYIYSMHIYDIYITDLAYTCTHRRSKHATCSRWHASTTISRMQYTNTHLY